MFLNQAQPLGLRLIFKIFLSMILAGILVECVVRVALIKTTGTTNHPVWGRIYKPGLYIHGTEGYSWTHINSQGLRGPEVPPKPPGEFRILALGDSYTEAFQVADEATYSELLEQRLLSKRDLVRVINGGRSGASPPQYIHLADHYLAAYRPDVVTVQLTDSDFDDSELFERSKNFYLKRESDQFTTHFNDNWMGANPLMNRFPALGLLTEISTFRLIGQNVREVLKPSSPSNGKTASSPRPFTNEAALTWFVAKLKAKYGAPCILHIADVPLGTQDARPSEVERSLAEQCARHGVRFVSTRDAFQTFQARTRQPVRGFNNTAPGSGHINEHGHRLVAEQTDAILSEFVATK